MSNVSTDTTTHGGAPKIVLGDAAEVVRLGKKIPRPEIPTLKGVQHYFPAYLTIYPDSVIEAFCQLLEEYNRTWVSLIAKHKEWPEDYQLCTPPNMAVQIDMMGLTPQFLLWAQTVSVAEVKEALRHEIFEIENSLAVCSLLQGIFANANGKSLFGRLFRKALADLRARHGKPIAILAITEEKYRAIAASEFGVTEGRVPEYLVQTLSGFDCLMGPREFLEHLENNAGECGYALYVRSSDPIEKLRNPSVRVQHELLNKEHVRRIIKANTLTCNIDPPDTAGINDTKEYMLAMQMGFRIDAYEDLTSEACERYLARYDITTDDVLSGRKSLRYKPGQGTYGCYGHFSGPLNKKDKRNKLRKALRDRGWYLIQPEHPLFIVQDAETDELYTVIDRVFFGIIEGAWTLLSGYRSMMPLTSKEAQRGRNHGSEDTVYAPIISAAHAAEND